MIKNTQKSSYFVKKSHLLAKNRSICAIFLFILLAGCVKQPDPVNDINDQLQQDVAQLIDYANNNMANDPDIALLKNGLKDCAARADAATKQHDTSIKQCQAETSKARAERNTLAIVLILLVAIKLFNIRA